MCVSVLVGEQYVCYGRVFFYVNCILPILLKKTSPRKSLRKSPSLNSLGTIAHPTPHAKENSRQTTSPLTRSENINKGPLTPLNPLVKTTLVINRDKKVKPSLIAKEKNTSSVISSTLLIKNDPSQGGVVRYTYRKGITLYICK